MSHCMRRVRRRTIAWQQPISVPPYAEAARPVHAVSLLAVILSVPSTQSFIVLSSSSALLKGYQVAAPSHRHSHTLARSRRSYSRLWHTYRTPIVESPIQGLLLLLVLDSKGSWSNDKLDCRDVYPAYPQNTRSLCGIHVCIGSTAVQRYRSYCLVGLFPNQRAIGIGDKRAP